MKSLKNQIAEREDYLSGLIKKKTKTLKNAPEGTLRVCPRGKKIQFYHRSKENGPNGKYLKKEEKGIVQALAQKEYDRYVLKAARAEMRKVHLLHSFYKAGHEPEKQLEKILETKREFIQPICQSEADYVNAWKSRAYKGLEFREDAPRFFSEEGERMRSKSEVIIANTLKKFKVPYRYECPLSLKEQRAVVSSKNGMNDRAEYLTMHGSTSVIYPDFTILCVSERKEFYWEHFGMLDNPEYLARSLGKVGMYEMNGIFPGRQLIITFETSKMPMDMELLERIIQEYCL